MAMRVEGKDEKAEKGKWLQRHFCVIYIDGRLYVGIKGKGEPCLMEMMIVYRDFESNKDEVAWLGCSAGKGQ